MKNFKKLPKKILAVILAVMVVAVSLPLMLLPIWADDTADNRVVDPSTHNSWQDLFPSDDTTHAGRIWTDKSVFKDGSAFTGLVDAAGNDTAITMLDDKNNFLVSLSALASNKSIVGYSYTPTDTMLVLDISGSMRNSAYVGSLVTAANDAIKQLLGLNNHNRVGVVLYSSSADAKVILPLDRYTAPTTGQNKGKFLNNSGQNYIQVVSGVKNSANKNMDDEWVTVTGGTYIQSGIYAAMNEFLAQDETVIPDGQPQAGTARTPIMVVMSDGLVTYGTNNFAAQNNSGWQTGLGNPNIGNGQAGQPEGTQNVMDFVTQLTAAYAKYEIDAHYADSDPLVYTLGLGSSGTSLNSAPLNPKAHTSTDELWEDYISTPNGSSLIEKYNGKTSTSIKKIAEISSKEQKNYVTKFYPATDSNSLITAFGSIVKQIIIQSLYYPTLVESGFHDHDGFIEFIDDIGHFMDVKDVKGIMVGDTFFTGEYLAKNFNTSNESVFFNDDGTHSELGNNLVWSVQERMGIENVQDARDLINSAYNTYQLRSWDGGWSNYIGWYADDNGNFMGHWHEGHTEADIPEINGVKATYINKSYGMLGTITGDYTETDLMYISTQVHTRIADGHVSVIWRVPASLIPIVTYDITLSGETIESATSAQINYKAEKPIRLLFEVGLIDDINPVNLNEMVEDKEAHIIDENNDGVSDDGKYYFYSNWWSDDNTSHENPSKTEDTIVMYEPSRQNEAYYYSEETPIYINTGTATSPVYQLYKGAMPTSTDGNSYFRKYAVFVGTGNVTDGKETANITWSYEAVSTTTLGLLTAECKNTDNSWDIPAGTVHRTFDPYNVVKRNNNTQTFEYVRFPVIEANATHNDFYIGSLLGNNGRIAVDIPQGVKISKTVDDTLYGTNDIFTFEVEAAGSDLNDSTIYYEDVNGILTEIEPEISSNKFTVEIKAGESVYVLGVDASSVVAVTEVINGNYKVSKLTVDGSVLPIASNGLNTSIVADKLTEIIFENTLVVNDGTLVISKEVTHDSDITYNDDLQFKFEVYPVGDYDSRQTFTLKAGASHTITNMVPGDYIVNEIISDIPAGFIPKSNLITVSVTNQAVATVHFENDYVPAEVKPTNITVGGTKTLSGRNWMNGDKFEFTLEMLDGTEWVKVGNTRTVTYGDATYDYKFDFANDADLKNIAFSEVGTYYFRVREVIPTNKIAGVTYDELYRYFNVVVTDATMDGQLEISKVIANAPATVIEDAGNHNVDIDFSNVYAPSGIDELVITINKTVDDKVGTNKSKAGYIFGFYAVGSTDPILTTAPTDANGKTTLDLSFPASTAGNEYDFEIREIVPEDKLLGMDYDSTVYSVKIKVVDNLDGTVTAVVVSGNTQSESAQFSFENVYNPDGVEVELSGTKVLEGRDLAANEFTFELYKAGQTNPVDTAKNDANGKFVFDKLTFDTTGTYNYTVKELKGNLGGIDYDTKSYAVKIIVSDDADNDGILDYKIYIDNLETADAQIESKLLFVNVYSVEEVTVELKATKKLTGRELVNGEFKFDLYAANADFSLGSIIDNDKAVVKVDKSTGVVTFKQQTFGATGTYRFVILEDEVNGNGITVDTHKYQITVIVTDNGKGKLVAEVKVDGTTVTGNIEDAIVFNNKYEVAPIDVPVEAFKTLSGRDLANKEFSFTLYNAEGKEVETVKNAANGKVTFTKLNFKIAGTYTYTIKEVVGNDRFITYDTKVYTVTITVADNDGKGYFDYTVTYSDTNGTVQGANFTNVYTPDAAQIIISGTKDLQGRDIAANEFTFEIYKAGETVAFDTAKNNANGVFTFDALKLNAVGTYNYVIKEQKGNLGGVTYTDKTYAVKIVVTADADGDGFYDYKLYVDNVETNALNLASTLKFVNTYKAKEVTVDFKATKKLSGRDLLDGEFKFDLYNADASFVLGTIIIDDKALVKVDNATGLVTFTTLTFDTVGTYRYVILEDELDGKGITTDKHKFQITVIVTDDGNGQLVSEVKVDGETVTAMADKAVFNNAYTVDPTDIAIEAEKNLTGKDLEGDDFIFELYDKDGNLIESVKNDADGKVAFSKLNITTAGTYVYTIKELKENAKGITYDATEYTVTVTVKDGGEGLFEVEIVYSNAEGKVEKAVFENTFTPEIPQTDDATNSIAWFMLMVISGGLALALVLNKKKALN